MGYLVQNQKIHWQWMTVVTHALKSLKKCKKLLKKIKKCFINIMLNLLNWALKMKINVLQV